MPQEIERKWVIKCLPFVLLGDIQRLNGNRKISSSNIQQFYIVSESEYELRCRTEDRSIQPILMTEKVGKGMNRREDNYPISERICKELERLKIGITIIKTRYSIMIENSNFEFDLYKNPEVNDKLILEVEFWTEDAAKKFDINTFRKNFPSEMFNNITEVTGVKEYKNVNIATKGTLKDDIHTSQDIN